MANMLFFNVILLVAVECQVHSVVDDKHGVAMVATNPVAVYENVEMLVVEVFKGRPTVKMPQVVLLAKEIADTLGDEEHYQDIIQCYNRWEMAVNNVKHRLDFLEARAQYEAQGELNLETFIHKDATAKSSSTNKRSALSWVTDIGKNVASYLFSDEDHQKRQEARQYIKNEMPKVKRGLKEQIKGRGEIITEIMKEENFENQLSRETMCNISINTFLIEKVTDSETYGTDIYDMSNVDMSGVLQQVRTIVDGEMLQKIVTLPEFNGTVYQDEPGFLKEYMEVRLERMQIIDEGAVFYYTFIFPLLMKGSLVPTFTVEQTGFFSEGKHYMLDLPKKLARVGGRYADIQCVHSIFGLCRMNVNSIRPSCLSPNQPQTASCSLKQADCGHMCSVNTRHGLLVTTMEHINAFISVPARTSRQKLVAIPQSESNVYFLSWANYTSVHIMGKHGREVLPPTTLVDRQYVLTTISDYVNFTFPDFHSGPTLKLHLDSLEAQLKKQMKDVANISVQVNGLIKGANSSKSPSFWTSLPLLLHAGQIIFFIYLMVQIIICCRERCNYQKARGQYGIPIAS